MANLASLAAWRLVLQTPIRVGEPVGEHGLTPRSNVSSDFSRRSNVSPDFSRRSNVSPDFFPALKC